MATKKVKGSREIPQELLTEIMSLLPVKSMARFNCVCKFWTYSLTTNAFLLLHSRSHRRAPNVFYAFCYSKTNNDTESQYGHIQLFTFEFRNDNKREKVKALPVPLPLLPTIRSCNPSVHLTSNICNGLVCILNKCVYRVLLFSVRINDFVVLPHQLLRQLDPLFDPLTQYWCSLGFDPNNMEYKLLLRIFVGQYNTCQFAILTLGSKSWKKIDSAGVTPTLNQGYHRDGSFCLRGVIYWIHERYYIDDKNYITSIASFDLAREEFRVVDVEQLVGSFFNVRKMEYCFLKPLNDCPNLFFWTKDPDDELFQLTLSDHRNVGRTRWIVTSYICRSILSTYRYRYYGGSIILQQVIGSKSLRYYCYDLENGSYKDIEFEGGDLVLRIGADLEADIA